jgi:hypothetical protein
MTHDTLDDLRELLPPRLAMLVRFNDDLPEIQEVWL